MGLWKVPVIVASCVVILVACGAAGVTETPSRISSDGVAETPSPTSSKPAMLAAVANLAAAPLAASRSGSGKMTLAVAYFDNNSKDPALSVLSKGLADMFITDLGAIQSLRVVEREKLEALLKEIKLNTSAYMDKSTAQKLGKGLGAGFLVTGSFTVLGDQLRLDVRVVEVETSVVKFTAQKVGSKAQIFDLQREVVVALVEKLQVKVARQEKRALRQQRDASFEALTTYSRGLAALDQGDQEAGKKLLEAAAKSAPDFDLPLDRLDALEQLAERSIKNLDAREALQRSAAAGELGMIAILLEQGKQQEACLQLNMKIPTAMVQASQWYIARMMDAMGVASPGLKALPDEELGKAVGGLYAGILALRAAGIEKACGTKGAVALSVLGSALFNYDQTKTGAAAFANNVDVLRADGTVLMAKAKVVDAWIDETRRYLEGCEKAPDDKVYCQRAMVSMKAQALKQVTRDRKVDSLSGSEKNAAAASLGLERSKEELEKKRLMPLVMMMKMPADKEMGWDKPGQLLLPLVQANRWHRNRDIKVHLSAIAGIKVSFDGGKTSRSWPTKDSHPADSAEPVYKFMGERKVKIGAAAIRKDGFIVMQHGRGRRSKAETIDGTPFYESFLVEDAGVQSVQLQFRYTDGSTGQWQKPVPLYQGKK